MKAGYFQWKQQWQGWEKYNFMQMSSIMMKQQQIDMKIVLRPILLCYMNSLCLHMQGYNKKLYVENHVWRSRRIYQDLATSSDKVNVV